MNFRKTDPKVLIEKNHGRYSELSPSFKVFIQKKSKKDLKERRLTSRETRKSPDSGKKEEKQNLKIQKFRFLNLDYESPIHSTERLTLTTRASSAQRINPFITNSFLSSRLNFSKIKIAKKSLLRQAHVFPNKKMIVIGRNLLSRQVE